ncbi:hypothetical protein ACFX2H_013324 [Malus domestica]
MASLENVFVMAGLVLEAIILMLSAGLSSASGDFYGNYDDRDESSSISPSCSTSEHSTNIISSDDNFNAYPLNISYPPLPNYKDGPPPTNFPDELLPEPSPGYYRHLRECSDEINPLCGHRSLRRLVKLILLEATFEGKVSEALEKSSQIWNKCVKVVDQADSPSPAGAVAF